MTAALPPRPPLPAPASSERVPQPIASPASNNHALRNEDIVKPPRN
jgi:hypothetical protein